MKPEPDPFQNVVEFTGSLFRMEGKGAWTFITIPPHLAPPVTGAWGMTPVIASVDGREWQTTVWTDKSQRSLLPVPKKIRRQKGDGDSVDVVLRMDRDRILGMTQSGKSLPR
ncbi:MAG: DUF1905 domain-containing protein [Verrucomicrobiales bacterium]|nr:DUF1905 domain-containing protein [Verrucomicrobiales bacterium]MCP5557591.1 DUF1905 domain-containing protein [Verrucomicrobiaceae bacterium]